MSEKNNKPQDSLERLFRDKAGEYDIPYREEDWLKLEKRLDYSDKQYARIRRLRWIAAASIMLFALLAYFTYDNYTEINRLNEQLNARADTEVQQDPLQENRTAGGETESGANKTGEEITGEMASADEENRTTPGDESGQTSQSAGNEMTETNERPGANIPASGEFLVKKNSVRDLYIPEISCPNCNLSSLAAYDERPGSPTAPLSEPETPATAGAVATAGDNNRSAAEEPDPVAGSRNSGLSLGLVMSPDLSTAGSVSGFSDIGYKIGVTFEYNLGSGFALSGGLIQSDVRYTARGNEYNPSGGYWNGGVIPDETFARCLLLDLPVTLKYEFLDIKRSNFFATAGISSYIMLNEDYRFRYDGREAGPVTEWSDRTGTRHWMSNAGFSIGYEYDIHANWSLRAEPFVRIPLKEVGWGNVNLFSMGSFFSINYKL